MDKKEVYEFCVIPNPFSNGLRNIVFISKNGEKIDETSFCEDNSYLDIKGVLEKFGYTETSPLQFESSNNSPVNKVSTKEVKKTLQKCGLKYNRELEISALKKLESFKNLENDFSHKFEYDNPIPKETKNKLIESKGDLFKFKHSEPEVGDKVTLYFYLFLELGFTSSGKPVLQFSGDFEDTGHLDNKNYVKIVKSEFKRVRDSKKPNSIILSSTKKQSDFLKEIGMLYGGYFKYQTIYESRNSMMTKENKYKYNLVEVKKYLSPEQSIVIETNRMMYDELMTLSNKARYQYYKENKEYIDTVDINRKSKELVDFLEGKMITLSDNEDFEEAAELKREVEKINSKLFFLKELDKPEITMKEYFKIFSFD